MTNQKVRAMLGATMFVVASAAAGVGAVQAHGRRGVNAAPVPLCIGTSITPVGGQTEVGSFPVGMVLSPDGRWIVVTDTGYREYLSVLSATDGRLVSQLAFNLDGRRRKRRPPALYTGLAFAPGSDPKTGAFKLFASRGSEDRISIYSLGSNGKLTDTGRQLDDPGSAPGNFDAQFAFDESGRFCYVTHNMTSAFSDEKGSIGILDTASNTVLSRPSVGGYPYAVAGVVVKAGLRKVYVASERDASVTVLNVGDPTAAKALTIISVGDHPDALLLETGRQRLFVANAGSDTVSIVDTASDSVKETILLRPPGITVPGATPTGLALSPDRSRLYVTLADLNALAVVDLGGGRARLDGYVPTGWYPTSVVVSSDGKRLFVANAKGVRDRQSNTKTWGPDGTWGRKDLNIMEGEVSMFAAPSTALLRQTTRQVLTNNRIAGNLSHANDGVLKGTGIRHIIYIVKENRTYDQVLGDLKQGNGDGAVCLFPRRITPNQHALAERFVLLDNFYVCGEVSADGWCWSTQGMASEYAERNVPFTYSGRGRFPDFEGQNNGSPVDLEDLPDVARAAGGYIWDDCIKSHVGFRNYGFFLTVGVPLAPQGHPIAQDNKATKRALVNTTDPDFYRFAVEYADSDAWVQYGTPSLGQKRTYGSHNAPCRFAEWKREFDRFVKDGNLPPFEMVRLMRDHTGGAKPGLNTPSAMVADNDYAVGELVEAISRSPYWRDTAIFVIEDDAQSGEDHVDCHRSPCYVISPHVRRGCIDHHFYNTDSVLRSMEAILGMPPMSHYDATAPAIGFLTSTASNSEPYTAIRPSKEVVSAVNDEDDFGARESDKLDFSRADQVPDAILDDIIWHSVKGAGVPVPRLSNRVVSTSPTDRRDRD